MDIVKLLKNVHNLNEYISTTQDATETCKTSKIQLNMSSVLALKKIRSLEIEYFNKCEDNGIACIIFERLLSLPPSKTWGVLSKELVNLLQYWLDAVRKHLVRHSSQWWTFLKLLLKFVKEIYQKDSSLPNILVEDTAECLLDLATNSRPDPTQRYEILHCFNMYCSESSREIRFALRNRLGQYFKKLATYMATCGHLPTQYSIMETLLRWLLPRQDRNLRIASAAKWFPSNLYEDSDVNIFLERPWINFFQDARDFLNAHNQRHDVITSVVCRKLTVGDVAIISDTDRQESWLDINATTKCLSVLLDPRVLETFGSNNHKSFETLYISYENTHTVKLYKESQQIKLSVGTSASPRIVPSCVALGSDVSCDVTAVLSTRSDVTKLDVALAKIFEDKYQMLLDLGKELDLSPISRADNSNQNNQDDVRFSHPGVEVKRRKHSGYIVHSRQGVSSCMSPSTASTSSLLQLHEKLAALPRYRFDKEPVSVCAAPELSIVTEVSEADDRQSLISTQVVKNKPYGVCHRNLQKDSRKSQSDPETSTRVRKTRGLSPCVNKTTTSCLLVATIGSADDSVINDTLERITKSKEYSGDNIVDLLVQEALQTKYDDKTDSGINTGEKKAYLSENSEAIDNTPNADEVKITKVKKSKVVSSTSDESNTDAINDTPCFVSSRKKRNLKEHERSTFDEQVVEQFFSQHFTENKHGEVVISPTLAKKINETSSETSDDFGDNFQLIPEEDINCDFNELEVLECLNNMVDKVCDEFDKCTIYLTKENEIIKNNSEAALENNPVLDIINTIQSIETKNKEKKTNSKKKNTPKIKLAKKTKISANKKKNKLELEPAFKMSTIIEDESAEEGVIEESESKNVNKNIPLEPKVIIIVPKEQKQKEICNQNEQGNDKDNLQEEPIEEIQEICKDKENLEPELVENFQHAKEPEIEVLKTPPLRRKRKLYSPKDENIGEVSLVNDEDIGVPDTKIKKTPKSTATCYKEIEKERAKRIRKPRSKNKKEPPSPRTQKFNDMFDKLKETTNGEKVKLVDKAEDIYNFTSDSDDDFKVIVKTSKKNSTTTLASIESAVSKHGRAFKKINYTDKGSSDESNQKRKARRPRTKKKVQKDQEQMQELVDERIRKDDDKTDKLNTSFVVEKPIHNEEENMNEFVPEKAPEMEVIEDKSSDKPTIEAKKKGNKKIKTEVPQSKKSKKLQNKPTDKIDSNAEDDRTQSPLPGLLVEPANASRDETNDISSTMVDKFKKFYQDAPDKYINDTNTTHNLLSDVERINFSQPDIEMDEEIIHINEQAQDIDISSEMPQKKNTTSKKNKSDKNKNTRKDQNTKMENESIEELKEIHVRDSSVIKSIGTDGITGHGESDEAPPSPKLINEEFEPRNIEVQDLDDSAKDYFDKLTKAMNDSHNNNSGGSSEKKLKSDSVKSASPVVSVHRLSYEEVRRWLPSRRNTESSDVSSVSTKSEKENEKPASKIDQESPTKNSDEGTPRKSLRLWQKLNQVSKINSSKSQDNSYTENTRFKNNHSPILTRSKSKVKTPKVKRLSKNISPIKLFDDMNSVADTHTGKSVSEGSIVEIGHTLPKNARNYKPEFLLRKNISVAKSIESISSKMSTSTKIEESRIILRRKISEGDRSTKKLRVEVNNNEDIPSGSGVTVSSVDEWFKRIQPDSSGSETEHVLQNVMEKLDTTLPEIHRNTSKQFAHAFVHTQKYLSELEQERRGMYKEAIIDINRFVEDKFAEFDKRSRELDNNFMKRMKELHSELLRQDCRQKRLMVQLLKEDIQAVLQHVKQTKSINS